LSGREQFGEILPTLTSFALPTLSKDRILMPPNIFKGGAK
jgi:hypothetical protein